MNKEECQEALDNIENDFIIYQKDLNTLQRLINEHFEETEIITEKTDPVFIDYCKDEAYKCGFCNEYLDDKDYNYCPYCGRKVKK